MGFLVRGGLVLIVIPGTVLPSLLNVAGVVGVRGLSINGDATPWLMQLIVLTAGVLAVWLVLACLLGSLADFWLVESRRRNEPGRLPFPSRSMLLRLAAIRGLCLIPLALALGFASLLVYDAAYGELVLPSQLATPFVITVAEQAWSGLAVVLLVWLAEETVAALAVRRQILLGLGIWPSLAGTFGHLARRPLSVAATTVGTYAGSAIAIGASMVVVSVAFDWCRVAARNPSQIPVTLGVGGLATTRDFRPVVFAGAVVALATGWALALAVSAVTSAWRSGATTDEALADLSDREPLARAGHASTMLRPSGPRTESSGN